MSLSIGNKVFMNLQEAVSWLLENNALPFQSTANYASNVEIAMSTLVNPSPAKVRVGSLIFFADSKVSTVVGVTSNSFIVSDQYNNLVDDIVYVSNVAINASGHLICTLSNGDTIDAGLIKQVSSFSIDASQHLIVTYNDGTTTDLGAIFSGNVNIAGNFTANSIIENMAGYSFEPTSSTYYNKIVVYAGAVKNGNKLTLVACMKVTKVNAVDSPYVNLCKFTIPFAVASKIFPTVVTGVNVVDIKTGAIYGGDNFGDKLAAEMYCQKQNDNEIVMALFTPVQVTLNVQYFVRYEVTFLLSENLAS